MQRNIVKQHEIIRSSTQRMLNKIVVWLGAGTNREPRQYGPWWNLGTIIWLVPFWNTIKGLINTGQWWVALWWCFFLFGLNWVWEESIALFLIDYFCFGGWLYSGYYLYFDSCFWFLLDLFYFDSCFLDSSYFDCYFEHSAGFPIVLFLDLRRSSI